MIGLGSDKKPFVVCKGFEFSKHPPFLTMSTQYCNEDSYEDSLIVPLQSLGSFLLRSLIVLPPMSNAPAPIVSTLPCNITSSMIFFQRVFFLFFSAVVLPLTNMHPLWFSVDPKHIASCNWLILLVITSLASQSSSGYHCVADLCLLHHIVNSVVRLGQDLKWARETGYMVWAWGR